MKQQSGNIVPSVTYDEHAEVNGVAAKKVVLIDNLGNLIDTIGGYLGIVIMAEDVNNPGQYRAIQGEEDSGGNFVLLTNGTGTTTETDTTNTVLLQNGGDLLLQTGDELLLQA